MYATARSSPGIIEELIPARGLQFNRPLSDSGRCSFSATVEPGRSLWRSALGLPMSGILVAARDGSVAVPVWAGQLDGDHESGGRTFDFTATEWMSAFDRVPAVAHTYASQNDHVIMRDILTRAQAVTGQDIQLAMGSTLGASVSDLTINAWDNSYVGQLVQDLANAQGGPEWYVDIFGSLNNPTRMLVQGDLLGTRLGPDSPVLEHVEDTSEWKGYDPPPTVVLLGDMLPVPHRTVRLDRRGGNVIAKARTQDIASTATAAVAIGSGDAAAQLRSTAVATDLLNAGWPRITVTNTYSDVKNPATLRRHASADLAAARGVATTYEMVTLDGDPDWISVARGSDVRGLLDTDVYGAERPVDFTARLLDLTVNVADDGPAQVTWKLSTVRTV